MAVNPEWSQISPQEVWEQHLRGDSRLAALRSVTILAHLDHQDFRNGELAERHGEFARIAQQTSLAAAKRSGSWGTARPYLLHAAKIVRDHYPLGQDFTTAQRRGNYWDPVYGLESAQRIAGRDILHLYQVLRLLTGSTELTSLSQALLTTLTQAERAAGEAEQRQRFDLIRTIESREYQVAKLAYLEFLRQYGFDRPVESVDQIITVSSIALGRAVDAADLRTIGRCLDTLRRAGQRQPGRWRFILGELQKNVSQRVKHAQLRHKLAAWGRHAERDPQLERVVTELEQLVFYGLGHNHVARLK